MLKVKENELEVVMQLIKECGLCSIMRHLYLSRATTIECRHWFNISVLPGTWEKHPQIYVAVEEHCLALL